MTAYRIPPKPGPGLERGGPPPKGTAQEFCDWLAAQFPEQAAEIRAAWAPRIERAAANRGSRRATTSSLDATRDRVARALDRPARAADTDDAAAQARRYLAARRTR